MKSCYWGLATALVISALSCAAPAAAVAEAGPVAGGGSNGRPVQPVATGNDGQALFQQYCAVCHPGGGNIINPRKTLDQAILAANGITTAGDIVVLMRQPGPGMTRFDENLISDHDAARIAGFILQAY